MNISHLILCVTLMVQFSHQYLLQDSKDPNLIDYFVNPDLGNTNYRVFESTNSESPNILFKQIIKAPREQERVEIEYYFMTPDSIPAYGGIEKISSDRSIIAEQYLYLDNRKIKAHTIGGSLWKPFSKPQHTVTSDFLDKASGLSFKNIAQMTMRIKDTLNHDSLIMEYRGKSIVYRDSEKIEETYSKGIRLYVRHKGIVYFNDIMEGQKHEYSLVEAN